MNDRPVNNHSAKVNAAAVDACPPFSPQTLEKQLQVDRVLRTAVTGMILLLLFLILAEAALALAGVGQPVIVSQMLVLVVFAVWFLSMMVNSRVVQQLPGIAILIGDNPAEAERIIAQAIKRKPLQGWVRLSLYHQLAVIRHQQKRFAEAAAICHTVLGYDLGPADRANRPLGSQPGSSEQSTLAASADATHPTGTGQGPRQPMGTGTRAHLLLMLIDAHLQMRHIAHAYAGLAALHQCRLNLTERLQLVLLQKRYEVMAGRDQAALQNIKRTIEYAELMPAVQCGVLHAMLATSAERLERNELAQWLNSRAELMLTSEQISRIWNDDTAEPAIG